MNIVVLGDGLLARSVAERLIPLDKAGTVTLAIMRHDAFDVTKPDTLGFLSMFDVAVNTVAWHRLGECQADPEYARLVNAEGAGNVAARVPTLYSSTDYVFNDDGPHDESLPGETPRSVYGQTKLAGELATLEHGGIVVRVAGLFGHYPSHKGPTFPETILSSHDPIRLPTDQVFSPTYAPDAARRIVDLALGLANNMLVSHFGPHQPGFSSFDERATGYATERPHGIYHAANDGSTSWAAFGQEIADLARHDRHISGYEARDPLRPKNSSLVSTRLPPLRHWRAALMEWDSKRETR